MRSRIKRQLVAVGVLAGWLSAVVSCALEPFEGCHPSSSGTSQIVVVQEGDDHHHDNVGDQQDAHHHDNEQPSSAHNEHENGAADSGAPPTDPCSDNAACGALNSALFASAQQLLFPPDFNFVLYILESALTSTLSATASADTNAPVPERVVALAHEVCTRSALFSTAPPIV